MGCPFVCCDYVLLPLVNKEADLTNSQAEQSQAGNPNRDTEGKKMESVAKGIRYQSINGKSRGMWQYTDYQKWVNLYVELASKKPEPLAKQL